MSLLALLLAAQAAPYVAFPQPGLDDPAAYEGYATRLYRDARGNAVQIYLDQKSGRVVHLWADALNESIGFTVRDTASQAAVGEAAVVFGEGAATLGTTGGQGGRGGRRWLRYSLTVQGGRSIRIGQFLLGSMRVERDFQYARRHHDSLGGAFVVPELALLVDDVARLPAAERRRALRLLRARDPAALRARLTPRLVLEPGGGTAPWRVRVAQRSLDGRNQLWLTVSGDPRRSHVSLARGVVTIRPTGAHAVELTIEIATDGPPLTPLPRAAIFNDAFLRFVDSTHSPRLEREVRGFELLSSREKLMAGLPNFATYFGRDMLMTALLMEPVWSDTMAEFVIAAALAKLAPTGEVSHEEALGGQAIREHAAEYNRTRDAGVLARLGAVRENYMMVDDDFQLPVVAARYFSDAAVPDARKRAFFARWREPLLRNLAFVAKSAAPYAADPVATNLVSFRRLEDGWWHAGSWRDSRVGYAGGRFAMDVNTVWVPAALRAITTIDSTLRSLGFPGVPAAQNLPGWVSTWRGAVRHFEVALAPGDVETRVRAKLGSLPADERAYWERVLARTGFPTDTLRFLALSLDSASRPIPVMSTDPAMLLLLEDLPPEREAELLRPFTLAYPVGLLVDGLGPLAANDAYAPPAVWEMFERDLYHSPRVVWGREVNVLLAALARRTPPLTLILDAVERSGLRHAELWSYRIEGDSLRPVRYGTSSDVQLWNLTDLAVQFLLARVSPQGN